MTTRAERSPLRHLPSEVFTRDGIPVDMTTDPWRTKSNRDAREDVTFPIGLLHNPIDFRYPYSKRGRPHRKSILGLSVVHLLTVYLCHYLQDHAPQSGADMICCFNSFERYLFENERWGRGRGFRFDVSDITAELIAAFGRYLSWNKPGSLRYLSHIRGFFRWGVRLRIAGFSLETVRRLERMKFPGGIEKNRIARSRDRKQGALLWEEQQQIFIALGQGKGNPRDRAIVYCFAETGLRPDVMGRLRLSNLLKTPREGWWELRVPRGKPRQPTSKRESHYIPEALGLLLCALAAEADGHDADPFLFHWLSSTQTTKGLRVAVARWARDVGLLAASTSGKKREPLNLTPYRFRRTRATNRADEGGSLDDVADELDHTSKSAAFAYIESSSSIVEVLEATLDRHPAWTSILNTFVGKFDEREDKSLPQVFGGVPTFARYAHFGRRIATIGRCASGSACNLYPPLSCYTCEHFRPTSRVEAHELQFEQLKAEADATVGRASDRMVAVLLPQMAAILVVIARLRSRRGLKPYKGQPSAAISGIASLKTRPSV